MAEKGHSLDYLLKLETDANQAAELVKAVHELFLRGIHEGEDEVRSQWDTERREETIERREIVSEIERSFRSIDSRSPHDHHCACREAVGEILGILTAHGFPESQVVSRS